MKIWKILRSGILLLLLFIIAYLISSFLGSIIPINRKFKNVKNGKEIYIHSNGVHLDIGFKREDVGQSFLLKLLGGSSKYLFVGWGDKGFYLDTPRWADLKVSTAIKAMFLPSETLLHTTYRNLLPTNRLYKMRITQEQFNTLINFVEKHFKDTKLSLVKGSSYTGATNEFYEAEGSYFFTYTCNQWVCEALKEAGVRTSLWSPFDKGIIYQLKKIK